MQNLPGFKRSVRSSASRTPSTAEGSSPLLRGTKRRQVDLDDDEPLSKRMSTEASLAAALQSINKRLDKIDEGLKENASKNDWENMRKEITGQMQKNTARIQRLEDGRDQERDEIRHVVRQAVEEIIDQTIDAKISDQITRNTYDDLNGAETVRKRENVEYYEARRSLRMWPVPDGDETAEKAARDYMLNVLQVPRMTIARMAIDFVRRVSGARRSKIEDEVLVRFTEMSDRDVIKSYSSNLSKHIGKAGIRLEVPTHLRHVFRLLETHAAELRKCHPGTKWSIKFDDIEMSLALDVKVSEVDGWMRITPEAARKSRAQRGSVDVQAGRATPGGRAGRRALMLPSPGKTFAFQPGQSTRTSGDANNNDTNDHHTRRDDWSSSTSQTE